MKKIDLAQLISIIANLGVIAGIVFLALELQQNNDLMAAEGRINRTNQARATWDKLVEQPEIASLLVKDRNGEVLTETEELRLDAFWMSTMISNQWVFQEQGYLPAPRGLRRNIASYGSLRRTWQGDGAGARAAGKDDFQQGFVQYVEESVPELAPSNK